MRNTGAKLMLVAVVAAGLCCGTAVTEAAAPGTANKENIVTEKATYGAGCFWGVEHAFRRVEGVTSTAVGYAGGEVEDPTYRQVCSGNTGHAEVVQVEYDPSRVSYDELLDVFWSIHNPTTVDRQGPDIGEQYRSVIFYHTDEQEAGAEASKQRLEESGKWPDPVVTAIEPTPAFYRAEEYHQRYNEKHGGGACGIR